MCRDYGEGKGKVISAPPPREEAEKAKRSGWSSYSSQRLDSGVWRLIELEEPLSRAAAKKQQEQELPRAEFEEKTHDIMSAVAPFRSNGTMRCKGRDAGRHLTARLALSWTGATRPPSSVP